MKFFIPKVEDAQKAERVYQGIRRFITTTMGAKLSDERIFRVSGVHKGKKLEARVGERAERVIEPVIAILHDDSKNLYYVCTPNKGIIRGDPYLVEGGETTMEEFEP